MKRALLPAALLAAALALCACQSGPGSGNDDPEQYKRSHDRYMGTLEPKTGGPDL